jgi:large conductance mechanosensitive channel
MSLLKEFREFAVKGNAIDMAVGIVIGAAFGTIVKTLVSDVIMPPIGLLLGGVDFSNLFVVLKEGVKQAGPYDTLVQAHAAGAVTLNYGVFINTLISFIIIAFSVFLLVKAINTTKEKMKKEPPAADPATKDCPRCLSTINIKATRCPNCTSDL